MKRIIFSLVVVAAIAISAVVVTSCGNIQAQGGSSAKAERWEYKVVYHNRGLGYYDGGTFPDLETTINGLGAEGWELVSAELVGNYAYFYGFFKRRLP